MSDDSPPIVVPLFKSVSPEHRERLAKLAQLNEFEYERARRDAAKDLGVRVDALDGFVNEARRSSGVSGNDEGEDFVTPEPWPKPVTGLDLAEHVHGALTRHVIFADPLDADAVTLWLMGTYLMDSWMLWPKVLITSPVKRCGKSTLLEVMEAFACRACLVSNIRAAGLFRLIDASQPTLLFDEADRFLRIDQELNGIINAGHRRRTAGVVRVEERNGEYIPVRRSVWGAQVIAGIGSQADTLIDRSVRVSLRRRMAGEAVVRLRFDYFESQSDVRRKLVRWALDDASMIRDDEVEPPEIGNDRARDNWTPLLRIAGALSGDWPDRAMAAYAAMEATKDQDEPEEAGVMLLRDVREVMAERGVSEIAAASLLEALVRREERPWAEWRGDRPISARGVARLLRSFDIKSQRRSDARVYLGKDLDEAAQRYLPEPPAPSVTSVTSVTGVHASVKKVAKTMR